MAQDLGWRWQHAALFSSMVASTDAVAVSAILHSGASRKGAIFLQSTMQFLLHRRTGYQHGISHSSSQLWWSPMQLALVRS